MKSKFSLIFAAAVLLGACSLTPTNKEQDSGEQSNEQGAVMEKKESIPSGAMATYTLDDVAKHNSSSDCWMVIDGGVYDVTSFIDKHPGGKVISFGCGKDASIFFHARGEKKEDHSDKAKQSKENFRVGSLAQ